LMRCSGAAAPRTASMRDWKPTDFTRRHRRSIRRTDGITTSVKAGWLSTDKTVVRRQELSRFAASEIDDRIFPERRLNGQTPQHGMLRSTPESL
jgi:hypothetical protein